MQAKINMRKNILCRANVGRLTSMSPELLHKASYSLCLLDLFASLTFVVFLALEAILLIKVWSAWKESFRQVF